MPAPAFFATYAGLGWALGQFGKRYGAVDENNLNPTIGKRQRYGAAEESETRLKGKAALDSQTQLVIDSCVSIVYLMGSCSTAIAVATMDVHSAHLILTNTEWLLRLKISIMLWVIEGLGTFVSIIVVGFAGRHSMTAVAPVVMNSLFAICAPILVAVFFRETLSPWFGLSMLCLLLGVMLASGLKFSTQQHHGKGFGPGAWIVAGSLFTAIFWSCGTLGSRYIMTDVPLNLKSSWSSVSYAVGVLPMLLSPILSIGANAFGGGVDSKKVVVAMKKRCKVCFLCGMFSGTGGLSMQYVLAENGSRAALIGLSQGVYNISCVLVFRAVYKETLSATQIWGVVIMLTGIIALSMIN